MEEAGSSFRDFETSLKRIMDEIESTEKTQLNHFGQHQSGYTSCIRIKGAPILAPVMTTHKRLECLEWKRKALEVEERLASKKRGIRLQKEEGRLSKAADEKVRGAFKSLISRLRAESAEPMEMFDSFIEEEEEEAELEMEEEDAPRIKRERRSSYTLDEPSPVLLAYMKRFGPLNGSPRPRSVLPSPGEDVMDKKAHLDNYLYELAQAPTKLTVVPDSNKIYSPRKSKNITKRSSFTPPPPTVILNGPPTKKNQSGQITPEQQQQEQQQQQKQLGQHQQQKEQQQQEQQHEQSSGYKMDTETDKGRLQQLEQQQKQPQQQEQQQQVQSSGYKIDTETDRGRLQQQQQQQQQLGQQQVQSSGYKIDTEMDKGRLQQQQQQQVELQQQVQRQSSGYKIDTETDKGSLSLSSVVEDSLAESVSLPPISSVSQHQFSSSSNDRLEAAISRLAKVQHMEIEKLMEQQKREREQLKGMFEQQQKVLVEQVLKGLRKQDEVSDVSTLTPEPLSWRRSEEEVIPTVKLRHPEPESLVLPRNYCLPLEAATPTNQARFGQLSALIKGHLTRRLLRTEKVQRMIASMRDTMTIALQLHKEATLKGGVGPDDIKLHSRLLQQIKKDSRNFHDVFFKYTAKQRMEIIRVDREIKADKLARGVTPETDSSTLNRRISAVTLAKIQHKRQIQQMLLLQNQNDQNVANYSPGRKRTKSQDMRNNNRARPLGARRSLNLNERNVLTTATSPRRKTAPNKVVLSSHNKPWK